MQWYGQRACRDLPISSNSGPVPTRSSISLYGVEDPNGADHPLEFRIVVNICPILRFPSHSRNTVEGKFSSLLFPFRARHDHAVPLGARTTLDGCEGESGSETVKRRTVDVQDLIDGSG